MKVLCILLIATLFHAQLLAQKKTSVKSKISEVTVFEQSAQVSRSATAKLPIGECHLVFPDLPHQLEKERIRFTAEGDISVESIYFEYRNDTLNKAELRPAADAEADEVKIQKLQASIVDIDGKLSVYKNEKNLLQNNSNFQSKEHGVDINELEKAATILRQRFLELHELVSNLEKQKTELSEEMNRIQSKKNKGQQVQIERWLELHVIGKMEKAGSLKLFVNYQVNGANWTPFYDARVTDISEEMELIQSAKVRQNSGEEWKQVKLTLSTGKPRQNRSKPALSPWILSLRTAPPPSVERPAVAQAGHSSSNPNAWLLKQPYDPSIRQVGGTLMDASSGEALPFATVMVVGSNTGTSSDIDGRYSIAIPKGAKQLKYNYVGFQEAIFNVSKPTMNVHLNESVQLAAFEVTALKQNTMAMPRHDVAQYIAPRATRFYKTTRGKTRGRSIIESNYATIDAAYTPTNVRFTADVPYTIPSNGREFAVQLQRHSLAANYAYDCTPKLDDKVYLTSRVLDWEGLDLLTGIANVYFGGSYVGQTMVDPQRADDTLSISLGIDESVRVERHRVKTGSRKKLLGGTRTDIREWRIIIRNNKTVPIKLAVDDQIPVSSSEEVKVDLNKAGGADHDEKTGRLLWNLELKPGELKELSFSYSVQRPKHHSFQLD